MNLPQTLAAGTLVLEEKAFVQVVVPTLLKDVCHYCFKFNKDVLKCAYCQFSHYCGVKCQKHDWQNLHKFECKILKNLSDFNELDILTLRAILKLRNGGRIEQSFISKDEFRTFSDLRANKEFISNDKAKMKAFEQTKSLLIGILDGQLTETDDELLEIFGKCLTNNICIYDEYQKAVGYGIYLGLSVAQHSCKPNLFYCNKGATVFVRISEETQDFDWSKGFVSCTNLLVLPEMRQKFLQDLFFFKCRCERCLYPLKETASAACENKNCRGYVDIQKNHLQCNICNKTVSEKYIREFNEVMSVTKTYLEEDYNDLSMELETFTEVFALQEFIFYKYNILHLLVMKKLIDLYIAMNKKNKNGHFDLLQKHGKSFVEGLRLHLGPVNPDLCIYENMYGCGLASIGDIDEYNKYFKSAYKQAKIMYGEDGGYTKLLKEQHTIITDMATIMPSTN